MIKVHFTSALNRFFPKLETTDVEAGTIPEIIEIIEAKHPGIKSFLLEDGGSLRKHVNIFIGEEHAQLDTKVNKGDEVFIFQALSGG